MSPTRSKRIRATKTQLAERPPVTLATVQAFFETLLWRLQHRDMQETVMMFEIPVTVSIGKLSATAHTYGELMHHLTAIRAKHDPSLVEKMNVFNIKETAPGRYIAHLEWNFYKADGALAQYSLLTYGLDMTNRGLMISSITAVETTQNAILASLPLMIT